MVKKIWIILLLFFSATLVTAQSLDTLTIQIISDNESGNSDLRDFEIQVQEEINHLLANRKNVIYKVESCDCEAERLQELFNQAFADGAIDLVIGIGAAASAVLAQQSSFPKPTIASIIIDRAMQNLPITDDGNSGINNFAYIQSPFSFEKDLKILYDIYPFQNVGIVTSANISGLFPNFKDLFAEATQNLNTSFTEINYVNSQSLDNLPEAVDALYIFPLFDEVADSEYPAFFEKINEQQLPSVALMGEAMVQAGALVGYEAQSNVAKMPRRIALDVAKIVDGINASELPVLINTFSETYVINMSTVRKVGTYPNWDIMTEAVLINANTTTSDRSLSLQTAILEALDNNLTLKIAKTNPLLAKQEVNKAKSELLPQLDVNTSMVLLDENTTTNSFGTKGRLNWTAGSSLSQLVYAEPALANVAIQKLLQKGEAAGMKATQLDVVLDAAMVYLSVLQAKSFLDIQSGNLIVTKNNLDIARAKDAVGYSGVTDLNRWKSELALGKIDLNDAQAQFQQAKYSLNQLLNQSIKEDFQIEDIGLNNNLLMVTDIRMLDKINNEKELDELADFLVSEALTQLPELQQLGFGLDAQERLLLSQKRAFYLPSVAATGALDHTLQRWDVQANPIPDLNPTWNLGLGVQYPILQGGRRKADQASTQLNILQIKDQQTDLRNQLELRVRAALQTASASYFSVLQFQDAKKAATDNFEIVQDSYSQGLVSVTNLIDAQNAKVQIELGAVNAGYQFIIDFMSVERAIGFYYQLANSTEQQAFFDRMNAFMLKN